MNIANIINKTGTTITYNKNKKDAKGVVSLDTSYTKKAIVSSENGNVIKNKVSMVGFSLMIEIVLDFAPKEDIDTISIDSKVYKIAKCEANRGKQGTITHYVLFCE